jgi:hypothetical protein
MLPSLHSLTNASRRLYSWFSKPLDKMSFDPASEIMNESLNMPISHFLHFLTSAASLSDAPENVLDRLSVVWIWLNKDPLAETDEHEYLIIETEDSKDQTTRLFVLDRIISNIRLDCPERPKGTRPTAKKVSECADDGTYQLLSNLPGLSNVIPSPSSPLSLMEEGTLPSTSTLHPPLSFQPPKHSIGDTLSLSATKKSQAVLDSLDNGDKVEGALDQVLGQKFVLQSRYGLGRNARQIKPKDLKLFELMVLAQVVHDFAPSYSRLNRNCYWFSNIMVDAVMNIFGLDSSISPGDASRNAKFASYVSNISGRYKGWKVSESKGEDLKMIMHNFKVAHRRAISEVKFFLF